MSNTKVKMAGTVRLPGEQFELVSGWARLSGLTVGGILGSCVKECLSNKDGSSMRWVRSRSKALAIVRAAEKRAAALRSAAPNPARIVRGKWGQS